MQTCTCPVCKSESLYSKQRNMIFYDCPICGRFELSESSGTKEFNINHLSSYLLYHSYKCDSGIEYRYNTVLNKEDCDRYKNEFRNGHNLCGLPVHMDSDIVDSWYPKSLAERVDNILKYLDLHIEHFGQKIILPQKKIMGILFVDRFDIENNSFVNVNKTVNERKKFRVMRKQAICFHT